MEESQAAAAAHRGPIGARFIERLADRQAERALEARLREVAQEIGRKVESLERSAAAMENLGDRIAARVQARGSEAEHVQDRRQQDAGLEQGQEATRVPEMPDVRNTGISMPRTPDERNLGTGRGAGGGNSAGAERQRGVDRAEEVPASPAQTRPA